MEKQDSKRMPLVSVIITCYNQALFLQEAVASVWQQEYPAVEVVVVDDGSVDATGEVAAQCGGINYLHQYNQGLSAARNTGIRNSRGELLMFLDADDWLLPGAISTNVRYMQQHPQLAFVSGGHDKVFEDVNLVKPDITSVTDDHYRRLLQGNYIGMHATVMYRRWVFDEFQYDTSLNCCEDYDLYLKIARKYPVLHHTERLAAYRLHTANMSANVPKMLTAVLLVLDRQQRFLNSAADKNSWLKGKKVWKNYYTKELYTRLKQKKTAATKKELHTFLKYRPTFILKYLLTTMAAVIKTIVKKHAPAFSLRWLHQMGLYKSGIPGVGCVAPGDFNRVTPFSKEFGYNRGGPVDRYYIEKFLDNEAASIRGRALEIGDNEYTMRFGGSAITRSDILHINDRNPNATIIGDISDAPHIPDNTFDCIVLTQTLHLIYDFKGALSTCHRILKPGGTLLLTVPGITPIDHGEWKETWYWSFTDKVMRRLMAETFPGGAAEVNAYGNVYVATAFLYGMGLPEVPRQKLDHHDPHYQVIVSVKAQKAAVR
ncbi:glycosyltransferase [Botryobacter ruber]|uniref:glycosyltransferase n=1 Tax=Botryobacter ruber TaxID=2171629 RepID=UPI000E0C1CA1|nr:glycosyltransferase [Botryobacter ruber]